MAPVMLPPSFYNSFWSPDYRSGLEVLFKNLEQVRLLFQSFYGFWLTSQGCLEDDDILTFVEVSITHALQ